MRPGSSPFELSMAGTIAVHLVFIVLADVVRVYNPPPPPEPAPHIEMFEIEVPPVVTEPPPPVAKVEEPPVKQEPVQPKVVTRPAAVRTTTKAVETPRPPTDPPPTAPPTTTATGGDQVVTLDSAPPSATGVAVAVGRPTGGRVGRGGAGGGTGAGIGAGAAEGPPAPVSVATIKKRAMPKGDYGYFDAGKDYPAEARQLGIEGAIRVRLVVDAQGKVASAVLLTKLGHGLDELALRRAKQLEFEPAIDTTDRAVSSVVVWTFNMTLPK